jgi:hypothetical protein
VSAPVRLDSEEASLIPDEWADAASRETRRQMGVWTGEPLPAYWPPYSPAAVERALAEARAVFDGLKTDEEAEACAAADMWRVRERSR